MLFKQKSYPLYNFRMMAKSYQTLQSKYGLKNPRFCKHFEFTYNEFEEAGALSLNA